ncbi:MAG: hypothetical protein ABSE89_12635 [Sedimentisphaerales bacterium]
MIVKIQVIDDSGKIHQGTLMLGKQTKNKTEVKKEVRYAQRSIKTSPSKVIYQGLYLKKFFQNSRVLSDVEKELNKSGCHYKKNSILMALKRAEYLTKTGKRGDYKFIQKYPPGE